MNAAWNIASCRCFAALVCIALAIAAGELWADGPAGADEAVRVQVLWNSASPTVWQGAIEIDSVSVSEFRPLGVSPDEANVLHVRADRIDVSRGIARAADGCEFLVGAEGSLRVELRSGDADAGGSLSAELAVAELYDRPEGTVVRDGERELIVRRAPHDRLVVEPLVPDEIFAAGSEVAFVSRHRIEEATEVPLEWKASLISLRDGAVVWTDERSSEPLAEGAIAKQEWKVPLPETEGVYRLAVQAFPRRFGSRWYRGEAILTGVYDVVALSEAPPVAESDGEALLAIRPGEPSWQDRVRSASPVRWFGFSNEPNAAEQGAAHVEQKGDLSWLVLEPGAVRGFPLPANPDRKGFAVEIDVASGAPGTIEVACCRGAAKEVDPSEAFDDPADVFWRVALVIPDLPAPVPTASSVETLRVLLPIAAEEGTLLVRSADPKRSVRLAEIRVMEEAPNPAAASDREVSLSPQSRLATLAVEDIRWPRRLSDGVAPTDLGPRRSARLRWYEAALRLARYAKAEGYDVVSVPAIAEGGALFPPSTGSPRLIDGPAVAPADAAPPIDALEILLAVFDRERVGVDLAYAPAEDEAFDAAVVTQRWQDLLDRTKGHRSFGGCLFRLPESRFDLDATAPRATTEDYRNFERALGLTLPTDPALRAGFLSRNEALWKEWQATQAVRELEELRLAANAVGANCSIESISNSKLSDDAEPPASFSLLERSGWTLWRRSGFAPTAPASRATQGVRFSISTAAPDVAAPTLGLRRVHSSEVMVDAAASRIGSAGERRLLTEFAIQDASGLIDGDMAFAPTIDSDLALLRRTLSSLPKEPFASASRRTPLGDDPLRVRTVRREDGLWVVAINLAPWPVRGSVEFGPGDVGQMRSLTERSLSPPAHSAGAAVWSVDLASFDVVAARFEGGTAEVADWRTVEPPPPGIDPATLRAAVDDLSRRLAVAGEPASRPSLFRESFEDIALENAGWRIDAESAKLTQATPDGKADAVAISPSGTALRLTSPALVAPATRSATVSVLARVQSSPSGSSPGAIATTPAIRLVALSGSSSVTTHVSARVDLAEASTNGGSSDAPAWRQIYVPIENVPEDFWKDWTVTLEVAGQGTLFVDELSILDGYPSPERLSAWRKQLAIAEYALREKRLFAAYEALNSPSMRLVRERFDLPGAAGTANVVPHVASPSSEAPVENLPDPAKPPDEPSMIERLWNWRRPEPVFR
jgi:hypothetical protein